MTRRRLVNGRMIQVMATSMIEGVLADAIKKLDDRMNEVGQELDRQREQYQKAVQPLEEELTQLQQARARLTGEEQSRRGRASTNGSASRRPRGSVKQGI